MRDPTPVEMRATVITVLASMSGRRVADWKDAVGAVKVFPAAGQLDQKWRIAIAGSPEQDHVVETAIALVRAEHQRVRPDQDPGETSPG